MIVDLTRGETARILAVTQAAGLSVPQTAYVLATACWETAHSMAPVREGFFLGTGAEAWRRTLRYYPFYGRGFVQLTWAANYAHAGAVLGLDLAGQPDLALDADVAARVLVQGMMGGWFTGRGLGLFVSGGTRDYVNARRVINGTDCADRIAEIADSYEAALTPLDTPALRRGDSGAGVTRLQGLLIRAQYDLTADGSFGRQTEAALCAFQRARGLVADGIAGARTWQRLVEQEEITT